MRWTEFRAHVRHLSTEDLERVRKAFELGKDAHSSQKRKSGEPYFTHPIAVAHLLADMGADSDTIIAALLHDSIEDTHLTLEMIDKEFDGSVTELVDGVTKLEKADLKDKPTLEQETESVRKIFTFMKQDVRIMIIKLVDRLHNMQTVDHLGEERSKEWAQETLDLHVKIADRLSMSEFRDELEALCLQAVDPKLYSELLKMLRKNEKASEKIINELRDALKEKQPNINKVVEIKHEHKSWGRLETQMETEGAAATGVTAATAVFVCKEIQECYQILGALHQSWNREKLSFEDFINAPMINGYRALHTTIILHNGTRVRCKIRTEKMDEYSRKGITTMCFDSEAAGILDYLPWTDRIATLSEDTADRSAQFWESLQSDILGDTIIVYGPNDRSVALPKGSTALDGAFYIFGKKALNVKNIKVDGIEVDFSSPLNEVSAIQIELEDRPKFERDWLQYLKTGFAVAEVRTALAQQSDKQKINIGKNLLQNALDEHRKGFIEEFDQEVFLNALQALGYTSIKEAYVAIADGHMEPDEVFDAVFKPKSKAKETSSSIHKIRYTYKLDDHEALNKLMVVYTRFNKFFRKFTIQHKPQLNLGIIDLKAQLTPEQMKKFVSDLESAGALNVTVLSSSPILRALLGICLIFMLWGLDPVVAKHIMLSHSVSPINMTLVRYWSLTCLSAIFLVVQRRRGVLPKTPIPIKNPSLWISVLLLVVVALSTYTALLTTPATHYTIPMTAAGLVTITMVNKSKRFLFLITWLLLIAGTVFLITESPSWPITGMFFTFLAVISFTAFSIVSEHYKRREQVGARSMQYFFVLSILCFIVSLPLAPYSTLFDLTLHVLTEMVLFSIIFVGTPYYLYYLFLTQREMDFVFRYSFLIIPATIFGQVILKQNVDWPIVLFAGTIVTLAAILPLVFATKKKTD
ncbi:MAG: HD domain-containing protein [Candidatus Peribacteraceae bacterium]|nr:HD domain-containing protein [Candidatus Peribacteraceae bacterium]MDP7454376.1 HD domain-containing protein [Candidatus Peribacteraceae bacterium]